MKNRKKIYGVVGALILCGIVGTGIYKCDCFARRSVTESLCAENPGLCPCYRNIVKYRFNDRDVEVLGLIQKEIKERGSVSALEFASLEEVQRLNGLVSICALEQMSRQVRQPAQPQQAVQPVQERPAQPQNVAKPVNNKTRK